MGNLEKVWFTVPEDVPAEEFREAFRKYFGAEWAEVLDAADKSFGYSALNNAYFSVSDLRPVENLTLEELLEKKAPSVSPNIVAS